LHIVDYRLGKRNEQKHQMGVGHTSSLRRILWVGDGNMVLSATDLGSIGIWVKSTDNQLRNFLQRPGGRWAHEDRVVDLTSSEASGRIASASADGSLKLWDISTRALVRQTDLNEPCLGVCFSPDGNIIVIRTLERIVFMRSDRLEDIYSFDSSEEFMGKVGLRQFSK
jgi:WD40 repeat protein